MQDHRVLSSERFRSPMPIWLGILISLLGGCLLSAAFIPLDLSNCVWIALIPLLIVLWTGNYSEVHRSWKINGLYGWCYGTAFFGATLWWLNEVSTIAYIAGSLYSGIYMAIWAIGMTTIFKPKFSMVPSCQSDRDIRLKEWKTWSYNDMFMAGRTAVLGGAFWVCLEWFRGWIISGFGWNGLAVPLYPDWYMIQFAEFVGATAMSFLPVLVNIWIWFVARRLGMMIVREGKRIVPWDFFALALLFYGAYLLGLLLSLPYGAEKSKRTVPVMAMQLNLSQEEKWDRNNAASIYESLVETTSQAYTQLEEDSLTSALTSDNGLSSLKRPFWIIWPESSFPQRTWYNAETRGLYLPDNQDNVYFMKDEEHFVGKLRKEYDFVLFAGTDHCYINSDGEQSESYNCLTMFTDAYDTAQAHPKAQLVPFGEYIPFRESLPFLEKIFEASAGFAMGSNFTPGTSTKPLVAPIDPSGKSTVQVIPLICFEDVVGPWVRKMVTKESQIMINVTNDGWFNQSFANEQHWRNAALRCIEIRRPMIRAANTGVSTVLSANGTPIAEIRGEDGSPFVKGYLYADVPADNGGITFYAQFGNWAIWLCSFLLIAYWVYQKWLYRYFSPLGLMPK